MIFNVDKLFLTSKNIIFASYNKKGESYSFLMIN